MVFGSHLCARLALGHGGVLDLQGVSLLPQGREDPPSLPYGVPHLGLGLRPRRVCFALASRRKKENTLIKNGNSSGLGG